MRTAFLRLSLITAVAASACLDLNPTQYVFDAGAVDAGPPVEGCSRECDTPPARRCLDASTLESFPSVGQCTAVGCGYKAVRTPCANGCTANGCVNEACAGVFCDSPPAPSCDDASHLRVFATGACGTNGSCAYSSTRATCAKGCADGHCIGDTCVGAVCDQPPAARCLTASTLQTYESTGTCVAGSCGYSGSTVPCANGCDAGVCLDDACAGIQCNQPPAPSCVNETTRRVATSVGRCTAGSCAYPTTDFSCGSHEVCRQGACMVPSSTCTPSTCVQGCCDQDTCVGFADQSTRRCGANALTCGGCGTGFDCVNGACVDINECANGNGGCDSNAMCVNTNPGRTCSCGSGYVGDGLSCTDVNECATNNGGCDAHATCVNITGGRTCTCNSGYSGDGLSCSAGEKCGGAQCNQPPIDTCANDTTRRVWSKNGTCQSGTCSYGSSDVACVASEVCRQGVCVLPSAACTSSTCANGCCDNGVCISFADQTKARCGAGALTCGGCTTGFDCVSGVCLDINECATSNGGCSSDATCTNTSGGRTCVCKSGYSGDGLVCNDVNECASSNGGCSSNATCTNTAGGRTCQCKSGYAGDGLSCFDIDECASGNGGCSTNANCTNTAGGRTCACKSGYSGDGLTCTDINECASGNGGCSTDATCGNTSGGRTCTCKSGYTGDGVTCTDIDECASNNGGCSAHATCTNTTGSRSCACNTGYSGDGVNCTFSSCPSDMAATSSVTCVDRYEASQGSNGKAMSVAGAMPWVSVSADGAKAACVAAGKHLCAESEWQAACGGAAASLYPYGNSYNAAACNGLDKNLGAIVPTAQVSTCLGGYTGVYDMSGNAYERTATCGNGACRVRGGSYRSSSAAGLLKCTTGFDFPEASPDDAVGFRCCL